MNTKSKIGLYDSLKSIQWKLVIMFLLLVVAVMIIIGTVLIYRIEIYFTRNFTLDIGSILNSNDFEISIDENKDIKDIADDEMISNWGSVSNLIDLEEFYILETIVDKIEANWSVLGISDFRHYYILSASDASLIKLDSRVYTSNPNWDWPELEKSPNIIEAMTDNMGDESYRYGSYIDYAKPVYDLNGNLKYIIYIKDTKESIDLITNEIKSIMIVSSVLAMAFAIIIGFVLARTITNPIKKLTTKAEKITQGDFDTFEVIRSNDEIGRLTKTFNYMASTLKNNIDEISSEKNKLETILLYLADGVVAFDRKGRVIHANVIARELLDIIDDDEFDNIFKKVDSNILYSDIVKGDSSIKNEKIHYKNYSLDIYFAPIKGDARALEGLIVVIHDITKQEGLETARREFVANVSHELKTPLTSIKSYTETLLEGALEEKEVLVNFLNVINDESENMTNLVKDLLLLSKIDNRESMFKMLRLDIGELLHEVIEKINIQVRKNKHTLEVEIPDESIFVFADRARLEQVIKNILTNAIKYTQESGKIIVKVVLEKENVDIIIEDNGPGIPKKDLPRIFERFYRVDKARSRQLGGTGLGLAIAKEIVENHNGEITIDSKEGEGTRVKIRLPNMDR